MCKIPLKGEKGRAHTWHPGHEGRCFTNIRIAQTRTVEARHVQGFGGGFGCGGVSGIGASIEHSQGRGAIEPTGIEMGEIETLGQTPRERAFTGRRRAVNGDNHGWVMQAPRPPISSAKPGKLVAIMLPSSMVTGRRVTRPKIRKAMAMR